MSKAHDDGEDSANANFQDIMSYRDYLTLNSILLSQNPKSNAHDEMLFIIQHQTSELWMNLSFMRCTLRGKL